MGQACFRTSQCARGLNCQVEVDACGTCQPAIAAGGDCGWWAGGCPLGTTCYDDRCLPTLKAAEACKTSSAPCEAGLECLAQGCAEKTAALGASCAAGDLCDPVKGLYCNFTSGLCEPLPAPVAVGERCGTFNAQGGRPRVRPRRLLLHRLDRRRRRPPLRGPRRPRPALRPRHGQDLQAPRRLHPRHLRDADGRPRRNLPTPHVP